MIKRIAINSLNQNKQIAKLLKTKKFAAIVQTDTVMGLISLNPKLIYEIKQRPSNKKLIFFVNNIDQVKGLNQHEKNVISQYWPGGLTVIKNGISYRMPDNKNLLSLIKLTGPLYSSSANISGNNPITDTTQAIKEFNKSLNNLLIIKGKTESNIPSTIIDLDNFRIIREGKYQGKAIMKQLKPLIYIGADHAGFLMKQQIIAKLNNKYNFKDLGTNNNTKSVDYPIYAFKVADAVIKTPNAIGILVCGTGYGMCIAANKVKGIRAICLYDYKLASLAKEHNDCNVITLSGRFNKLENNIKIINNFMKAKFDHKDPKNIRHVKRIKLITKRENKC